MIQYIPKAAVVAEIRRLSQKAIELYGYSQFNSAYNNVLKSIDTLEVKDVDLDKIINDYFKDWKFDEELDIMVKPNNYSASFTDLKEIAKHFFELGLKATQKGE